jgi:hypothetical protein
MNNPFQRRGFQKKIYKRFSPSPLERGWGEANNYRAKR